MQKKICHKPTHICGEMSSNASFLNREFPSNYVFAAKWQQTALHVCTMVRYLHLLVKDLTLLTAWFTMTWFLQISVVINFIASDFYSFENVKQLLCLLKNFL